MTVTALNRLAAGRDTATIVKYYTPTPTDRERTSISVKDLSRGARFTLWSIRKWVQGKTRKVDVAEDLCKAHRLAGIPEGLPVLEEMMALLATATLRPVLVECPCSKVLSMDEVLILRALRSLQTGHAEAASQRMQRLISGSLANAFCRSADAYVHCLQKVGLSLNAKARLSLVGDCVSS